MRFFFSFVFFRLCRLTVWTYRATTQALGQCRQFIAAHLPEAKLVSVASTAAAAETISTQADAAADSAAICSKICLRLFADLEMLHEGIQDERSESNPLSLFGELFPSPFSDETPFVFTFLSLVLGVKDNFTRFYILASYPLSPLPNTQDERIKERNALVRLEVLPRTEPQDAPGATVADLLAALRLPVVRVDRRPSTSVPRERFGSVYFVEVMDNERSDDRSPPQQQPQRHVGQVETTGTYVSLWKERVLGAIGRVVESGGRADLLGTW